MKLTFSGYEVCTAEDGAAAVSAVRREKPDLILLDLSFPPDVAHGGGVPWDGFLIIEWLRRIEEAKDIPFIVVTGGDPAKFKDRALAVGAASFFHKPIDSRELLTMIRQTLDKTGNQNTAPAPA
jgi:DNA-binding response OmpR family regulator